MSSQKQRILILCTGNSARSQMAEALINARYDDRWLAFSAGTQPAARVNPYALEVLSEIGVIPHDAHPKHLSAFLGQPFDLVVTVCDDAQENCPFWPGQGQRLHVGFPDPAAIKGTNIEKLAAFRGVRDDIIAKLLPLIST